MEEISNYKKLLRDKSGNIIVTSSQPFEYSYTDSRNGRPNGSRFTNILIKSFDEIVRGKVPDVEATWENVLNRTKKDILAVVASNKQTPIWGQSIDYGRSQVAKIDYENVIFLIETNTTKISNSNFNENASLVFTATGPYMQPVDFETSQKKLLDTVFYTVYLNYSDKKKRRKIKLYSTNAVNNYEISFKSNKDFLIEAFRKYKDGKMYHTNIIDDKYN